MTTSKATETIALPSSRDDGDLFCAFYEDSLGHQRRAYFYAADHETAAADLKTLPDVVDRISQVVGEVDVSDIPKDVLRRQIISAGGTIMDESFFETP